MSIITPISQEKGYIVLHSILGAWGQGCITPRLLFPKTAGLVVPQRHGRGGSCWRWGGGAVIGCFQVAKGHVEPGVARGGGGENRELGIPHLVLSGSTGANPLSVCWGSAKSAQVRPLSFQNTPLAWSSGPQILPPPSLPTPPSSISGLASGSPV